MLIRMITATLVASSLTSWAMAQDTTVAGQYRATLVDGPHSGIGFIDIALPEQKCSACHTGVSYTAVLGEVVNAADSPRDATALYTAGLAVNDNQLPIGVSISKPAEATAKLLNLNGGVVVDAICPGQSAGLQIHDIILKADEKVVAEPADLVGAFEADKNVILTIKRAGADEVVKVKLDGPKKKKQDFLIGIMLGELDPVVNAQLQLDENVKVFVDDVVENSAADGKLMQRDILLKINGNPVTKKEDVTGVVKESKGKQLTLKLLREGKEIEVNVKPAKLNVAGASADIDVSNVVFSPSVVDYLAIEPHGKYITYSNIYDSIATAEIKKEKSSSTDERLKSIEDKIERLTELIEKLSAEE